MITLTRFHSDENGTFGKLTDDLGEKLAYTCELPWLNNKPNKSCIPTGVYNCISFTSVKHPDVWQVCNVPGRSGILIHTGNTEHDSLGCIVVGDRLGEIDGLPAVINSVATIEKLRKILPGIFELTIS